MTSGPLCLPIGNGRQASRTGPGMTRRYGRLFVASPRRGSLHFVLFLVLMFVGCSSGQGRLEGSADPVLAEGSEVSTAAGKERPAETETTDTPPGGQETTDELNARAEIPDITEEEVTESNLTQAADESSDDPEPGHPASTDPPPEAIQPQQVVWEEDGIREEFGAGYTKVVLSEILGEDGYKYSYLEDPPRLVVDVKDPSREVWFNRLDLKGGAFERIRVGRHPDKIRFVLDLREEGQPEPLVEPMEDDLIVLAGVIPERPDLPDAVQDLEADGDASVLQEAPTDESSQDGTAERTDPETDTPAVEVAGAKVPPEEMEEADPQPVPMGGPEEPLVVAKADWKPVRVQGIDFRQTEAASDVIIATSGAVPIDVEEKDDSIVIVLPGAQIPEHLQWPIDTKAFPSAILAVNPEQVGTGPTGKVKITIRLREKRPYNVLEEEKGVRVSVLLPETPPEIPLLPPPDLPATDELAKAEPAPGAEMEPVSEPAPAPEPVKPKKEAPEIEPPGEKADRRPAPGSVTKAVPHRRTLDPKQYRGKKISLDFKDADIQNVLRLIAEVSDKNIVISEAVKGKVTIRLLNVPWDMALDVILKTYALEKEELGPNILRVAPYSQLKREREEALKAEEALERVESLQTRLVPVNYAKAKDLESVLARLKSKRPDATILVDSRTNSLIIRDLPLNISEMVELVRSLDTQTPQVLIEAKIVELDVDYEKELGIQWGTLYRAGPATGNPTGLNFPHTAGVGGVVDNISGEVVPGIANPVVNLPAAVDESGGGALGFSLASITNSFQLEAQLSALEKRNHARVLSSPRVATLSNQEARINQGQEVPYQTTSDEGTKTEFKEAVLELSVTPQITFDRSIIMNILVTNDTPIRDPTVGFIIGTKQARTTVLVKDGDTAVIGGIYTNNDAQTEGGVPYLMDLPVAGSLFKKKGDSNQRTELIIFITPRIIPNQFVEVDEWADQKEPE